MSEGQLKTLKRAMIVYKKAWARDDGRWEHAIVKLRIPAGARVVLFDGSTIIDRKCRAERAEVLSITCGKKKFQKAESDWRQDYFSKTVFLYKVGKKAIPSGFDTDVCKVCTKGIHFFRTLKDAKEYDFL